MHTHNTMSSITPPPAAAITMILMSLFGDSGGGSGPPVGFTTSWKKVKCYCTLDAPSFIILYNYTIFMFTHTGRLVYFR